MAGVGTLARAERDAYLARLGLEAEPPSVEALFRLHRRHAERVPYETLWIHMGERWGVAAGDAARRIATQGRGGYCFHLNGAMGLLLGSLGYTVVRHVGGVHGPPGPAEEAMANHLVLTVHGLPSASNPAGVWYADVGLGDALWEPLPLMPGEYRQPPWRLVLETTPGSVGDWHLAHDPAGGFLGMSWRSGQARAGAFTRMHRALSTRPESGFVRTMTVQTRDAAGVTVLHGLVLKRIGEAASESEVTSLAALTEVLGDVFGLDIAGAGRAGRAALWDRLRRAHAAWEAGRAALAESPATGGPTPLRGS